MCKFCDLDTLDPESFDSFFEGAATNGYKSMVCKHCATTFLTGITTLGNTFSVNNHHTAVDTREKSLSLL